MQGKRFSAFTAAALSLALVAGACGGSDGDGDAAPEATAAVTDATAAPTPDATTAQPPTDDTVASGDTTPVPDATDPPVVEEQAVSGGDLVMAIEADSSSPWRPAEVACAVSCHMIMRSVFDPLTVPGSDDLAHPYLASALEPNADFTEWRITAREGVTFHDGTPLDGAAIAENLTRSKSGIITGSILRGVTGVEVDPSDPMVAVVTLSSPNAQFPFIVSGQAGYIASPTWLAASDGDGNTLKAQPVGTGPFIFADFKPGEFYKGTKNPDYWNAPYPYLDSIEFRPIADALARRDALKAGDVDLIHASNAQVIADFRATPDEFPMTEMEYKGETTFVLLHVTAEDSALSDQRVRCGLANAMDMDTFNASVNQGVFKTANGPFPESSVGYLADTGYPVKQDMAKAQELIAAYKAENPGELKIAYSTSADQTNLVTANFVKQWWEEAGVDEVTINQVEQLTLIIGALGGSFQANLYRLHNGFDLDQQYHWWSSTAALPVGEFATNFGRIRDDEMDALFEANRISTDPAEKQEIAENINRIFGEQCYNLWTWWTVWGFPHKATVHGADAAALTLPDGTQASKGSHANVGGVFAPATLWMES